MNDRETQLKSFDRLLTIMDTLRQQCPWDKAQTMESLRNLTIEETYELADAILDNNIEAIKNELGDLLLHIVFYAKIGAEKQAFDIGDVNDAIAKKLIERHPHIYKDTKVKNKEEVKQNWEKLKLEQGNQSVLEGVPKALPALIKAIRIQDKVSGIGFDWKNSPQVWQKVQEELLEFNTELENKNQDGVVAEFGDLLFSLINYAQHIGINPENALERTNKKFIRRFQYLEKAVRKEGKSLATMSLPEMNSYWEKSKTFLNDITY